MYSTTAGLSYTRLKFCCILFLWGTAPFYPHLTERLSWYWGNDTIVLLHISYNAPFPCTTRHHLVLEMCTRVHISVTKWCILGRDICLMQCGMFLWAPKIQAKQNHVEKSMHNLWNRFLRRIRTSIDNLLIKSLLLHSRKWCPISRHWGQRGSLLLI